MHLSAHHFISIPRPRTSTINISLRPAIPPFRMPSVFSWETISSRDLRAYRFSVPPPTDTSSTLATPFDAPETPMPTTPGDWQDPITPMPTSPEVWVEPDVSAEETGQARRSRTVFSPTVQGRLMEVFSYNRYPDTAVKDDLATELGLSSPIVQTWFHNQRQRTKRQFRRAPRPKSPHPLKLAREASLKRSSSTSSSSNPPITKKLKTDGNNNVPVPKKICQRRAEEIHSSSDLDTESFVSDTTSGEYTLDSSSSLSFSSDSADSKILSPGEVSWKVASSPGEVFTPTLPPSLTCPCVARYSDGERDQLICYGISSRGRLCAVSDTSTSSPVPSPPDSPRILALSVEQVLHDIQPPSLLSPMVTRPLAWPWSKLGNTRPRLHGTTGSYVNFSPDGALSTSSDEVFSSPIAPQLVPTPDWLLPGEHLADSSSSTESLYSPPGYFSYSDSSEDYPDPPNLSRRRWWRMMRTPSYDNTETESPESSPLFRPVIRY